MGASLSALNLLSLCCYCFLLYLQQLNCSIIDQLQSIKHTKFNKNK